MDEFLLRAMAAGLGLALAAGPFGCFVVWRRMAYFGDTLAHSALLGVAAGIAAGIDPGIGIVAVAIAAALLLTSVHGRSKLASDTVLGIVSHSSLAFGLVALSQMDGVSVNMNAWLLGDILSVTWTDVALIWLGGALMLGLLRLMWPVFLAMTVDEDLAAAEGKPVLFARLLLMLMIALVVAGAMKAAGVLLVTAMLIIPAAAARVLARNPEQMALFAMAAGAAAVLLGLSGSWAFDAPSGPSIAAASALLFAAVRAVSGTTASDR